MIQRDEAIFREASREIFTQYISEPAEMTRRDEELMNVVPTQLCEATTTSSEVSRISSAAAHTRSGQGYRSKYSEIGESGRARSRVTLAGVDRRCCLRSRLSGCC